MDTMYVSKRCSGRSVICSTRNHPWKVYNMLFLGYFIGVLTLSKDPTSQLLSFKVKLHARAKRPN